MAKFKQKDCFALLAMTEFFEFCRVSLTSSVIFDADYYKLLIAKGDGGIIF